ncbi:MAG: hypothetical protein DRJ51_03885 [Thermoprotei archaeon]|nr:MAG: hypothetical protein DRJ51_03885 [Thermoprotei archaeon]
MNITKAIVPIILPLLIAVSLSPLPITIEQPYKITELKFKIYADGSVEVTYKISLNYTTTTIELPLYGKVYVDTLVVVNEEKLPLTYEVSQNTLTVDVAGSREVVVVYLTDLLIKNEVWILEINVPVKATIILPHNSSVVDFNTLPLDLKETLEGLVVVMPQGSIRLTFTPPVYLGALLPFRLRVTREVYVVYEGEEVQIPLVVLSVFYEGSVSISVSANTTSVSIVKKSLSLSLKKGSKQTLLVNVKALKPGVACITISARNFGHEESISVVIKILEKKTARITLNVEKSEFKKGEKVKITGKIDPPMSVKLVIELQKKGEAWKVLGYVATDKNGAFTFVWTAEITGELSLRVRWEGSREFKEAVSNEVSIRVKEERKCFIATATYGSELSPEVSFLRGFRDNIVKKTFLGSCFMEGFNAIYYSFSPHIASIIEENAILRNLMKVLLYPLILSLKVSAGAFFAVNPYIGTEAAVVLAGFVASSLIGALYMLPIVLLAIYITRRRPLTGISISLNNILKALTVLLLLSLFAMATASYIQNVAMAICSSLLFVSASALASPAILLRLLRDVDIRNIRSKNS